MLHGFGRGIKSDGVHYIGAWTLGIPNGTGKRYDKDGTEFY